MRQFIDNGTELIEQDGTLPEVDILVLGAHNDDEMFPAGYLLNRMAEGNSVGVAIATDGAGSNWQGLEGQALVDRRTEESRLAIWTLGGSYFVGYDHPSSHLKSDEGMESFADELAQVIAVTKPSVLLVQSPWEDHYTHIRTTEAGILAARAQSDSITEVLGYEVWTPMLGMQLVRPEPLTSEIAQRKLELQEIYQSQNDANPYHESTQALTFFNSVMADSHRAAGPGHAELYFDMTPLVKDERFADIVTGEYGGMVSLLTQVMRATPEFQVDGKTFSREELLDEMLSYAQEE